MTAQRIRGRAGLAVCCLAAACLPLTAPAQDAGKPGASDIPVRCAVIPTGFQDGEYTALVQVAVEGSPLPDAAWDLRASFAFREGEPEHFSERVVVGDAGTPAVLEIQTSFKPGPYELTLSARETSAGQSGTGIRQGRWPDPDTRLASVSPIAVLQPVVAVYSQKGEGARRGALGRDLDEPVHAELPAALVSVVCRGPSLMEPLRVDRHLLGATRVDFDPIELTREGEPCAQVRDMIRPGTLTDGSFQYRVRLLERGQEIAVGVREFDAVTQGRTGSGGSQAGRGRN